MGRNRVGAFAGIVLVLLCWNRTTALAQNGEPYPQSKVSEIGGEKVKLVKTGQAVRKKLIFSVYSVACYVPEGVKIRTAKEIVDADCPKVLHLTMLRGATGKDMAENLLAILRQNHPAPAFAKESKSLQDTMIARNADLGDQFLITHVPKVGLHFQHVGGEAIIIRDVAFSKALWENYFGKHNVGEEVKTGLLSLVTK
jgi:hypothetical protein